MQRSHIVKVFPWLKRIKRMHPLLLPNGISVIISCQDDSITLRDCVESFKQLADEIIIVSNLATTETVYLCETLEKEDPSVVKYINAGDVKDLYENRQKGLELARYRWVMRCDADYVAYEKGDAYPISKLRDYLLGKFVIWPCAVFMKKVCLSLGWRKMYDPDNFEPMRFKYIPRVWSGISEPRIYTQNFLLSFQRLGRKEGAPYKKIYKKIYFENPFWFEVTIRSPVTLLMRQARTDWREFGDFKKYPTLDSYFKYVFMKERFPNMSTEDAAKKYLSEVMDEIEPYDELTYWPLPQRIKNKNEYSYNL